MIIDQKCFEKRQNSEQHKVDRIQSCEECPRCYYCQHGIKDTIQYEKGALELGCEIVKDVALSYEEAYMSGFKNKKNFYENWLRSEKTSIFTADMVDGYVLLEKLEVKCLELYGKFETIYNRVQKEHKAIIRELKQKLKVAETKDERKELQHLIRVERGILNA